MNLADAITRQAQLQPDAVALVQERGPALRFAQLDAAIRRTAKALLRQGLVPGELVGVAMLNEPLHVVVLLALARLGAVSVPVHPGFTAAARRAIVAKYAPAAIVSDPRAGALEGCPRIDADPSWLEPGGGKDAASEPAAEGGGKPWRIALGSGTTGAPKGAAHTHDRTLMQLLLHRSVIEIGPRSRFLGSADLNITFGLNPCLRHLFAGSAVIFPRLPRADRYAESIDRYGVTHMSASPVTLRRLLEAIRGERLRFPSLEHLAVSGGLMPPELIRAAFNRVTRNLWAVYGASEVGVLAIADRAQLLRQAGTAGRAVPWVEAQAVDENEAPLSPGRSGALRFRGLSFSEGYFGDPEASARAWRGGWFYPGDTGSIGADGLIVLDGRSDDLVNLGGNKVQPETIERVLESHPEVVEAAAFGAKNAAGRTGLFAAIVTRGAVEDSALAELCRKQLGPLHTPVKFFRVPELPRGPSGKLLRRELSVRAAKARRAS